MTTKDFFDILNIEIAKKYKKQVIAAEAMGTDRQSLNKTLRRLATGKGITLEKLMITLDFFGYELIAVKKETANE